MKIIFQTLVATLLAATFISALPAAAHAQEMSAQDEPVLPSTGSARVLLIPHAETVLSSEISARINKITVDMGDHFRKGSLLVKFDCAVYQAELDKAVAEEKEARKNLEVVQRLDKLGSVSELETAAAAARVEQMQAVTAMKRHQVARCAIHAPFAGGVVKRTAAPHQYITPGQPLLEIIATENIDLQIFIPSQWLLRIKSGTPFTVTIEEVNQQYNAVITAIGVRIDSASQTLEIRGTIRDPHPELLAGMSGTARFDLK